jgi:DNA-binding transcriptional LysR family regulator
MTLHQLRIAIAIAKQGSVTKASAELHISQPSVSQQIKLLEQEYGFKLYVKSGKGIEVTQEGQKFIESAAQILLQVDRLAEDCKRISSHQNGGSLRVGGCYFAGATLLPLALVAFKKMHPGVQLVLENEASSAIEELVLKSKLDIALVINPSYDPSLVYEPYRKEKLVAVVSANHPLAQRSKLNKEALSEIPIVFKQGTTVPSIMEQFCNDLRSQGVTTTIALSVETPDAMKAAVKAGMGLGVFFREHVEQDIKRGSLKIINIPEMKFNWKFSTYIIYHKERSLSLYATNFLTLLRQWSHKANGRDASRGVAGDYQPVDQGVF